MSQQQRNGAEGISTSVEKQQGTQATCLSSIAVEHPPRTPTEPRLVCHMVNGTPKLITLLLMSGSGHLLINRFTTLCSCLFAVLVWCTAAGHDVCQPSCRDCRWHCGPVPRSSKPEQWQHVSFFQHCTTNLNCGVIRRL